MVNGIVDKIKLLAGEKSETIYQIVFHCSWQLALKNCVLLNDSLILV